MCVAMLGVYANALNIWAGRGRCVARGEKCVSIVYLARLYARVR